MERQDQKKMSLLNDISNNLKFIAIKSIENKIDGRDLGVTIEKTLDEHLGEKMSEKTQREPITNLLLEILEGLWKENLSDLVQRVEVWIKKIKTQI